MKWIVPLVFVAGMNLAVSTCSAGEYPARYDTIAARLLEAGLRDGEAFDLLGELTSNAGSRLSGSPGAEAAVELTRRMMAERGFDNVHLEPVMVPHWVRGDTEEAFIVGPAGERIAGLTICALGGSIGTPPDGIRGEVLEVHSFKELQDAGETAGGKVIFFNRPFDRSLLNTFAAYGGAVDQRSRGAVEGARAGAVGVLVRSMTNSIDDSPHTGALNYADDVPKIPAAAISTLDAEDLSSRLKSGEPVSVLMRLSCQTLPDVLSHNVVGEIRGSEVPEEVIVVGGHLDSWDKGTGAHDDGAGCMQAIEVLSLIRKLGLKPKRTIRAVMFMNEENGIRGAKAYPIDPGRAHERHIAGIESDRGGFAPRGISVQADSSVLAKVRRWQPLFEKMNAGRIEKGYSGVDLSALVANGMPGFGLDVENHRYFDYHHSENDTIDKVHPRELELGAIVQALLCYLLAEEGL
jgi:hypothetical protein